MSECRRIQENLVAFLSGEMDEKEKARVKRHLDLCPRCQQELALLQQTIRSADSLRPEMEKELAAVDWEALPEKLAAAVWKEEARPQRAPARRGKFWLFAPRLRPVLAGLLVGIILGGLATFLVFRGRPGQPKAVAEFFASRDFLNRVDQEIARRATLDYLEKSQYVLLELSQTQTESGQCRLTEAAARETRELLSKKKYLNPQLEKVRMAKAKAICDQIEFLFYELSQVSENLTPAQCQGIQRLIEERNILLKIKLLKKELQESEV